MANIAIDIDGTFDTDPALWRYIIEVLMKKGNNVFIVSGSFQSPEKLDRLGIIHAFIIQNGMSKKQYMESIGINIDIWIDNEPWLIAPEKTLTGTL